MKTNMVVRKKNKISKKVVAKKKVLKKPVKKIARKPLKKIIKKQQKAKKPIQKIIKKKIQKTAPKKTLKKVVKKILKKKTANPTKKTLRKSPKKALKKVVKKKLTKKPPKKALVFQQKKVNPFFVQKFVGNPIMEPNEHSAWESEAVFNPAAVLHDGKVHLFYRALGPDGMSRIGYASSPDGINFYERLTYPVYMAESIQEATKHRPYTSPARLAYNTGLYASGGGWGGCEDPRAVKIGNDIYMTFNIFNGWNSIRVAAVAISGKDLSNKNWNWSNLYYLSKPGDRQKNWVLFPEKINGKFAVFHNLDKGDHKKVHIAYLNNLDMDEAPSSLEAVDPQRLPDHDVAWHYRTRSAAAPPIKTKDGWLLFYHAMDKNDSDKYKVGAMLLDLKDPTKVLYRADEPVIEPDEWYENDWKPGIVYLSGAVVKDGTLFLYYGGGDKRIAVAHVELKDFINKLKTHKRVVFAKEKIKIK